MGYGCEKIAGHKKSWSSFRTGLGIVLLFGGSLLEAQPAPMHADNIQVLIDSVLKGAGKKGEFESSAEYEKRLGSYFEGRTSFRFEMTEPVLRYDADQGAWTGMIFPERVIFIGQDVPSRSSINLVSKELYKREYQASNAFGASTTVTERDVERYGLIWDRSVFGSDGTRRYEPGNTIRIKLPMLAADAKEAKGHLKIFLECELQQAKIYQTFYGTSPTISLPLATLGTKYFLMVEIKGAEIVDDRSGSSLQQLTGNIPR